MIFRLLEFAADANRHWNGERSRQARDAKLKRETEEEEKKKKQSAAHNIMLD